MRSPLLAPALARGDTVGLVSPSSPLAAAFPRRLRRGVRELQRRGFRVQLADHALAARGHTAGTAAERARDLNAMFADPHVAAVLAIVGGHGAAGVLEHLDYELIAGRPKLLVGYSDTSALLLGLHARTGLATLHGPALLPQLGEAGGCHPFTWNAFARVAMRPVAAGVLPAPRTRVAERLAWDGDDVRPRRETAGLGPCVVRRGLADGPLLAANTATLLALAGTPFLPALDGAVLLLEEGELETPATVEAHLIQLRQMGVFERIAGLGIGRFPAELRFATELPFEAMLDSALGGTRIPVATGLAFGHVDPTLSLPLGVRARLHVAGGVRLELLAPAVTAPSAHGAPLALAGGFDRVA